MRRAEAPTAERVGSGTTNQTGANPRLLWALVGWNGRPHKCTMPQTLWSADVAIPVSAMCLLPVPWSMHWCCSHVVVGSSHIVLVAQYVPFCR